MKHLKEYKIFESDNSSIWNEIEDILTPIKDEGVISFKIQNFKYVSNHTEPWNPAETTTGSVKPPNSVSSLLIKKDWSFIPAWDGRYFDVKDIKDELNHLCSRFPNIINQVQIFRTPARNPNRFTPEEFIKESPVGTAFLVAITFNIQKEGSEFIPR